MSEPGSTSPKAELRDAPNRTLDEPGVTTLVGRFLSDAQSLVEQEISLAKEELADRGRRFAIVGGLMAGGALLVLLGLLLLLVFVVLGLGALLGHRYWLSSLLVGSLLAGGGITAALFGRRRMRPRTLLPTDTFGTLRDTAAWARKEAGELRTTSHNSD